MQTRIPALLFSFLFVFGFSLWGKAQNPDWKWQNPLPTGNDLNNVQFLDTQTGWAVGRFGTLLKTSNSGQTWQLQKTGTNQFLYDIQFIDAQTGWTVGNSGTILKTTDAGLTWQSQVSGLPSQVLISCHFIDLQTGWAVGSSGKIIKTTNGGNNWILQLNGNSNSDWFYSVYFIDSQTGWAVGSNNRIVKTTDGGNSWNNQNTGWTFPFKSVQFLDSQTGWVVGDLGNIWKTSNGGQNWQPQSSGTNASLSSVNFIDSQNGWVVGSNGLIMKSTNGGQSWQMQNTDSIKHLYSIHFNSIQIGWIVGQNGTILKTTNNGNTWKEQKTGPTFDFQDVFFIDPQIGWALGYDGSQQKILKTTNGGQSWQNQSSGITTGSNSIYFINAQTGWAVGANNSIIKTSNGGNSWSVQNTGTLNSLREVHFIDAQTGWAVGGNGTILKTNNGGITWISKISGTTNYLRSVFFTDSQNGYIVSWEGNILKTTDGGETWIFSGNSQGSLYSCFFVDAQTGWAVGAQGVILKTTNSGNTWFNQNSTTTNQMFSVYFSDSQNGWVSGLQGLILKTSNGGITWEKQISGTLQNLSAIHFTDPLHGWAVGANGTILTTITNNYIDPETPTSLLKGKLFEKTGSNCNPSNIPVTGKLVKATPGPYYGYSTSNGNYSLRVPLADSAQTFTLQPIVYSNSTQLINTVCPPSGQISVTIDTIPDTLSGNNFGFEITSCHHLDVQLSSNRRRRCFVNTTSVSYVNQGSLSAPNAYVLVEFPHWVKPVRASRSYVAVNDSVWRFDLNTVSAGEYGAFTITDSVLCGNVGVLGLSQCTKATIFPAPDCPPQSNWSGAEVSVSGKCHNGFVELGIYNKTSTPMPDSVDYWVYLDSIQVKQAKVKLAAGDSLKLWVEAFGMPVYLTANQVANHPSDLFVTTSVEACDDTVIFYPRPAATRFPIAQRPNSKTQCLPIIGAYDPNDKQVFPIGFTNQNIIAPNTQLEYLVRFQNTGNDTAFTVYVIDTLDQNLNVESFEMGAASHPFELSMQTTKSGKTFLRWQFNNILLPDSNTNEPASNGFIQFRISPKPGLALGSKVRNHAEIYFDFNPPIITNQTLTTYDVIVFKDSTLEQNVQSQPPTSPSLSTVLVSGITLTSAISGGNITASGGPNITSKGVVWNTAPNPTIALSTKTSDGSGTGAFSSNLTGLQPSTLYYVRAYATNSVGTSYGEERQFTTLFVGLDDLISTGKIKVFPNPFSGEVNISSESSEPVSVSLFDVMGKELLSQTFSQSARLEVSPLQKGVYYLKVKDGSRAIKLVKQ